MEVLVMAEKLSFAEKLQAATNEDKQVNPIYVNAISTNLSKLGGGMDTDNPKYDLYTDGVFDCYYLKDDGDKEWFLLQLECKQDVDLDDSTSFAKVLLQVLYYLKKFDRQKWQLPKVIVLGTKKNCLALPLTAIYDAYIKNIVYPEADENGKAISASTAPNHYLYAPLLNRISSDAELQTQFRVIEVTDKNAVKELCIDILKTAKDLGIKEEITTENLSRAFDFFDMKVLTEKSRKNLSSRVKAEAFMQLMLNPTKVQMDYTSDVLGNIIFSGSMNFNGSIIEVEGQRFNSFANLFAIKNHNQIDEKKLTEITDRLIEDTDRRRKGDFYTPTIWVSEAHKLMSKHLGDDWKQKCIVWDCAWGTGNLTRDYRFSDIYCSTIMEEDLKIGEKYNPFATKFQYDFLNDDVDLFETAQNALWTPFIGTRYSYNQALAPSINFGKILDLYADAEVRGIIPEGSGIAAYKKAVGYLKQSKLYSLAPKLIDSLLDTENQKPMVFLINPPYGTSKNNSTGENNSKSGIAKNEINEIMKDEGWGMSCRQLYTQFLYRIYKISLLFGVEEYIGAFTQSDFLSSVAYREFRDKFYKMFNYLDGFVFSAGEFNNTSDTWGISFTAWSKGETKHDTVLIVKESDIGSIIDKGTHTMIEAKCLFNKEIRERLSKKKSGKSLYMKSALNVKEGQVLKPITEGCIGGFQCNGNTVTSNTQYVAMYSAPFYGAANMDITRETALDCMSLFTARRLIVGEHSTWINWKDEYMTPNKESQRYNQWEADSIVYSLFNSKSQQSSLRNIEYNGKTWNIYNEFFWLSREQILSLASGESKPDTVAPAVYDDCIKHAKNGERFVYEKLQTVHLSDDAKFILDFATAILIDTMKYREEFNRKHPEYHINTWDAGWYQIKALAKEYTPDTLKMFNEHYKAFEDRMRPLVYELGFLYE